VEYPDAKHGLDSLIKFEDSAIRETYTRALVLSSIFVNCKLTLNANSLWNATRESSHRQNWTLIYSSWFKHKRNIILQY